jgi:hypothetical protein
LPYHKESREQHPRYGTVTRYNTGLACADCGCDAHVGPCRVYTCTACGTECGESGCSEHPRARVRVVEVPRPDAPRAEAGR